jgi:argininosuccinate lyase
VDTANAALGKEFQYYKVSDETIRSISCLLAPVEAEEISLEVLGKKAELSIQQIKEALDPVHFVKIRDRTGGPALEQVLRMLKERTETLVKQKQHLADIRASYERARGQLADEVEKRVRGSEAL